MKLATRLMLAVMVFLVFTPWLTADGCRRVTFVRNQHHVVKHHAAVVVEKKIVLVAPEIPIYYPALYGAQYIPGHNLHTQPGGAAPAPSPQEAVPAWAKEMVDGFRLLKDNQIQVGERIRKLEERMGLPPVLPARPMPRAEPDGQNGGPAPTGVKLAPLSPEAAGKVVEEVLAGRMPRGKPFTDAEKIAFLRDLSGGDDARILARLSNSCASCHDRSVADTKGKKFVLTEKGG